MMTSFEEIGIRPSKASERSRKIAVWNDSDDRVKVVISDRNGNPVQSASINYDDARCLEIMLSSVLDVIVLKNRIYNDRRNK